MTPVSQIPTLWKNFQTRWNDRDDRMDLLDQVVSGEWSALDPDDEALENRSPNLVQVALEDTAESAAVLPTVRVTPSGTEDADKGRAAAMERLAASYMDISQYELLNIRSLYDLVGFGFHAWVVAWDEESGSPRIEWRDPRTCYPEPGWRTMDSVRTCMFARDVFVRQLPAVWREKVDAHFNENPRERGRLKVDYVDSQLTLVELYEEDYITVVAMYAPSNSATKGATTMTPIELDRTPTPGGICPVVIGQRPSLDNEPRGQFDQVIDVMKAHIRLMALVLDYADQAVYSDIWVKDLVGQMSFGGGAYIQLGPQGAIGRVPPAVSSLAVSQELSQLVDNIHLGGRWPKSRPGEVDQAIASAKFLEATAGMMNTAIRTLHLVMKRSLEQALRIAFKIDKELGANRTVAGVLRNQQFLTERKKSDIDLKCQVRADYGIALGRDQQTTMVLGIQGIQTNLWSTEFVQENFDGLTDVMKERERIDVQKLQDMAFAQLLQMLQGGALPNRALVEIARRRQQGDDIFELFEEFVVKPAEEAAGSAIQSGLGAPPMQPGPAPSQGGPPAPPAPAGEDLLGALMGGGGNTPQGVGRLSVPAGGRGSFAGVQTTTG